MVKGDVIMQYIMLNAYVTLEHKTNHKGKSFLNRDLCIINKYAFH